MNEPYPVGTRVVNLEHRNSDGSRIYGRVVEDGPSFYGTTKLKPGCMWVALEQDTTNPFGDTVLAGTIFVGTPRLWSEVPLGYTPRGELIKPLPEGAATTRALVTCCECESTIRTYGGPISGAVCAECWLSD